MGKQIKWSCRHWPCGKREEGQEEKKSIPSKCMLTLTGQETEQSSNVASPDKALVVESGDMSAQLKSILTYCCIHKQINCSLIYTNHLSKLFLEGQGIFSCSFKLLVETKALLEFSTSNI